MRHICTALALRDEISLNMWAPPGQPILNAADATSADEAQWLDSLMRRGGISHLLRSNPITGIASAAKLLWMLRTAYKRATTALYHVNWLQCAIALPDDGKPALITVLGNDMHLLKVPLIRRAVRRALRGRTVTICPNAEWMAIPLRDAFGDLAHVETVPFGIAADWYQVTRTPALSPRWLAVTRITSDKLGPLFEWCEHLFKDSDRELHLFGPMQEQITIPDWVHYHGAATPEALLHTWFPQAHGLISLSRHAEGRPQVMLEAMAAGLPIIASQLSAHSDLIEDRISGLLCNHPGEFSEAITLLERREFNSSYGAAGRSHAEKSFGTWNDCAQRYLSIYRSLLEK